MWKLLGPASRIVDLFMETQQQQRIVAKIRPDKETCALCERAPRETRCYGHHRRTTSYLMPHCEPFLRQPRAVTFPSLSLLYYHILYIEEERDGGRERLRNSDRQHNI